ncbi:histidine phosphatase family protein [Halobacillus mangrovi]|uniref:histidine phosphatase family protein n=1 Tax=Halobacillus mangrovi TaxID=402384 RepID=UPI003D9731F9
MDRVVDLYIIRHGITEGNIRKQYIGWSDLPLHQDGVKALHIIRPRIPSVDMIWTSDLVRCIDTAARLFPEKRVKKTQLLREIHFGDWERRSYEDLKANPLYRKWVAAPSLTSPPGGELYQVFQARIEQWLLSFFSELDEHRELKSAAVITHGGVLRELMHWLYGDLTSTWNWSAAPGEGYHLQLKQRRDQSWTLLQGELITAKPNG